VQALWLKRKKFKTDFDSKSTLLDNKSYSYITLESFFFFIEVHIPSCSALVRGVGFIGAGFEFASVVHR
jgi:hypothetical protein